jgi:hypothetical protein
MNTTIRNMIRRLNVSKASEPKGTAIKKEGYRCPSDNDEEFVWETLNDGDDADVVWESLSSLTLQGHSVQSSSRRRSSPFMMLDASPKAKAKELSPDTLLNDTIIKGSSDTTLLRIAEHSPGLLGHKGDNGRFPVHVACAYAASSDFISKCVSLYPHTAAAQDNDGKTPFHILCESYAKRYESSMICDCDAMERRMTSIIWVLYRKAPTAIIVEDNHGVGAVEYALEAGFTITFIGLLQNMVARVHESNAKKKAHRKLMQGRCPLQQKDSPDDARTA